MRFTELLLIEAVRCATVCAAVVMSGSKIREELSNTYDKQAMYNVCISMAKELENNVDLHRSCMESEEDLQGDQMADDEKEKRFLKVYHIEKFLSKGSFGNVTLVKRMSGDGCGGKEELFAMKTVPQAGFSKHVRSRRNVEKEVFLCAVGHPFLIQLHSYFETKVMHYYVMVYMPGGTLWSKMKKEEFFSEKKAGFYAAELTLAVEFLHKCGVVHQNIKQENILLDEDGHCKLADYGLAELDVYCGMQISHHCGTPSYFAPEVLRGLRYGPEVDWWSLGIVMYEMMAGHHPFLIPRGPPLAEKILKNTVLYPQRLSWSTMSILNGFLTKDPRRRLGAFGNAHAIKEHQFFKSINWQALLDKQVKLPFLPHNMDVSSADSVFISCHKHKCFKQ